MRVPVKRYLNKLIVLDKRVQEKQEERARLFEAAKGTSVGEADPNKVQASHGNRAENAMIRYADISKEVDLVIARYMTEMDRVTNDIHQLNDDRYERLLFLRYVPEDHRVHTLEEVARLMFYSYDYIVRLHGQALNEFRRIHADKVY
mgnify:CR=1 FL=1